jgi:hypothetical protein
MGAPQKARLSGIIPTLLDPCLDFVGCSTGFVQVVMQFVFRQGPGSALDDVLVEIDPYHNECFRFRTLYFDDSISRRHCLSWGGPALLRVQITRFSSILRILTLQGHAVTAVLAEEDRQHWQQSLTQRLARVLLMGRPGRSSRE